MAFVVEALDGGVLDCAVHALDLTVGPRMAWLGQPVLDVEIGAGGLEGVAEEGLFVCLHLPDVLWRPAVPARLGEVRAVVGEHGVDLVGNGGDEVTKEVARDAPRCLLVQLDEGELGRAVDGHEEVELALLGPDLGDVDMEEADRVALEPGALRLAAVRIGQPADPVALEAAVQGRAGKVGDGGLERVEAVVQRQERVAPESDDDGLLLDREHG